MALSTFTTDARGSAITGGLPVFLDANLTQRAAVVNTNGTPAQGNVVNVAEFGVTSFQVNASTVYFRAGTGKVTTLTSASSQAAERRTSHQII